MSKCTLLYFHHCSAPMYRLYQHFIFFNQAWTADISHTPGHCALYQHLIIHLPRRIFLLLPLVFGRNWIAACAISWCFSCQQKVLSSNVADIKQNKLMYNLWWITLCPCYFWQYTVSAFSSVKPQQSMSVRPKSLFLKWTQHY